MRKVIAGVLIGGAVLLGPAPAVAHAENILIAICMTLDDYPSISGVRGILNGMMENGIAARQAGRYMGQAVAQICPEHLGLVERYMAAYSSYSYA